MISNWLTFFYQLIINCVSWLFNTYIIDGISIASIIISTFIATITFNSLFNHIESGASSSYKSYKNNSKKSGGDD